MNILAPKGLIDSWDNTGFQIGNEKKEINKILISLDLDDYISEYAIKNNFHMIINHHPAIFKGLKSITTSTAKGKILYDLIRNDIVVFNAHTNLDQSKYGLNHILAELLGLKDIKVLSLNNSEEYGYGRVGDIDEKPLVDYIYHIKKALDVDYIKVYGKQDLLVKKVAVCGGSGADFIVDAFKENADIYITGDIKYHEAQMADELGLTLIDAGHYHTEKVVLKEIKRYLEDKIQDIEIEVIERPSPFYKVY